MSDSIKAEIERALADFGPVSNPQRWTSLIDRLYGIVLAESSKGNRAGIELKVETIPGAGKRFVIIDTRGPETRHFQVLDTSPMWIKGRPRPTQPGAYHSPERPANIYTLTRDGYWYYNLSMSTSAMSPQHVPEDLVLLGAL